MAARLGMLPMGWVKKHQGKSFLCGIRGGQIILVEPIVVGGFSGDREIRAVLDKVPTDCQLISLIQLSNHNET